MVLNLKINEHLFNRADSRDLLLQALAAVDDQSFACIRMVTVATADGSWTLFFGEVVVSPEAMLGPQFDLGRMRVVSECLKVPDLVARLQHAFQSGRFQCASIDVDVAQAFRQWGFWRFSSDRNYSRWPCIVAEGQRGDTNDRWVGPFAAVADGSTRYFRDGFDVVRHVTTFPVFHGGRDSRLWSMSIIIEDHRSRISRVERDAKLLKVHLEGHSLEGLQLAGQICDDRDQVEPFSLPAQPEVQLTLPKGPVDVGIGIVGVDAEMLDYRDGHIPAQESAHVPDTPDVLLPPEPDVVGRAKKLLQNGENARCEHKPWVPPARSDHKFREIVESAVAMANGRGGTIVIGVDDHGYACPLDGHILGRYLKQAARDLASDAVDEQTVLIARQVEAVKVYGHKVRDEIQKLVEPSVDLDYEVVTLDSGPVLLLEVRPGTDHPYVLADNQEIYVRINATNRRPTREELRQLFQPITRAK